MLAFTPTPDLWSTALFACSARAARRVNERAGKRGVLWQRGYYEHVIRTEKASARIRAYIAHNPVRWADDPENISRAALPREGRV
jgi:REP element-mobilizing transposase RayT